MDTPPSPASSDACRRVRLPLERRLVLDTLRIGRHKPMMHALLELDVTRARRRLREIRAETGEALSFTAYLLACLGQAVAAHPEVHAVQDWLGRAVLFQDVDAATIVEVEVEGRPFALAHVVRAVNRRTVRQIHDEIRAVQAGGMRSLPAGLRLASAVVLRLPGGLRRLLFRAMLRFPRLAKRHTGTALVSSVGMFSGGAGWGFSAPGIHNLSVVVGGIAARPGSQADGPDGGREPREVLCLTVAANHDLIDGAPLARFLHRLRTLVESAEASW